jgi:hypothetical protein
VVLAEPGLRLFERGTLSWPGLRIERGARRIYRLPIPVPYYDETRQVEIRFEDWSRIPKILVDGPTDSPHRYSERQLCIWYPDDPPEEKWVFEDGLLMLINLIQLHLFREAWWREHGGRDDGEWLGPQVPHGPRKDEVKEEDPEREQREVARRGRSASR